MIQLYGKRVVKTRNVPLGPQGSQMETGYGEARSSGGGIQPGAHPEYEGGTKLGNPLKQLGDLYNKMTKKRPKTL